MTIRYLLASTALLIALSAMVPALGQAPTAGEPIVLGSLATGAKVSFVQSGVHAFGIAIGDSSSPVVSQMQPAQLEVYTSADNIKELNAAYKTVNLKGGNATAKADLSAGGASFQVTDIWSINDGVLSVHHEVRVSGDAAGAFRRPSCLLPNPTYRGPISNFLGRVLCTAT